MTMTAAMQTATGTTGDRVTVMMRSAVLANAFEKISSSLTEESL